MFVYFDDREIKSYIKSLKSVSILPSISIACSPQCNLNCPHCIYNAGKSNSFPLTVEEKIEILQNASKFGAKYLQICHEGEPFLDEAIPTLIEVASNLHMKTFMYTNATLITPEIAEFLYKNEVCLGVKLDSLNPAVFNLMLGRNYADSVYQGIHNLIKAGYDKPFNRNGTRYTRLSLVCTLTSINTKKIGEVKDVARFAWSNNLFFGAARLEQGGRATGSIWEEYRISDCQKVVKLIDWCSEQTGIDYWDAQPTPYCIGVCGLQVADNGDVWMTKYGGSCDFTEPDGESYPEELVTIANVRDMSLEKILRLAWDFREKLFLEGALDKKLHEYMGMKDVYPNGLQDCGSAKTYTLFVPFYNYIRYVINNRVHTQLQPSYVKV